MNKNKRHFLKVALGYLIFEVIMYLVISFSSLQLNPILWSANSRLGFSVWTIFVLMVALVIYIAIKAESNRPKEELEKDQGDPYD